MNKFDNLDKTQAIDLINHIVDMRPIIPSLIDNDKISMLVDNETIFEYGSYIISIYFRESDKYIDKDGNITYGDFKSLYKVTIRKRGESYKFLEVKDYVLLFNTIIGDVYENIQLIFKIDNEKVDIKSVNDDLDIDNVKIIIKIKKDEISKEV